MSIILILLEIVLFLLSAFFSSAETILFSLNAIQIKMLRERNPRAAGRIEALLKRPTRFLSTLIIGNTVVNIVATSIGYSIIHSLAPRYSAVITVPLMTVSLLIFGEVAPKRFAIHHAQSAAPFYSRLILFFTRVLTPLCALLELIPGINRKFIRPERKSLTDEELATAFEVAAETGEVSEDESNMIDGILRLSVMTAADVMTPRVDMIGIDLDDPPAEPHELAASAQFHFLPVFRRTPDNIEGILNVAEFFVRGNDWARLVKPALFVPETMTLDDLLLAMQKQGAQIAIILDEYGGTAGLVSRGDILEIVTGEMPQINEEESADIQEISKARWLINGEISLDEINHELDLELEAEGADRLAGWATEHAGRFLRAGESVEAQGCRVQVRRVRRHRIEQVILEKLDFYTDDQIAETAEEMDIAADAEEEI